MDKVFNFEIKGNDVEDLIKVVGKNGLEVKSVEEDRCIVCGESLNDTEEIDNSWCMPNGSFVIYRTKACVKCAFQNTFKK